MNCILLSPHADDEALFASYTILRLKPIVIIVTDYDGGKLGITAEQRRQESISAMEILGTRVTFLGIPESKLTEKTLHEELGFCDDSIIFCPAIQGGHKHHDLVARYCLTNMKNVICYATYTKDRLSPDGNVEIIPTREEMSLKNSALDCYKSQFPWNQAHFDAVRDRSEFYVT